MTITLFQRQDLRGDSAVISRDEDDLRDLPIGRNPSSMRMTSDGDKILLFKNDDWQGGVMFRRGAQTIDNFGAPREGGRNTFGNNIASVRVTPFFINLNVTVVTQSDGTLPGGYSSFSTLRSDIEEIVEMVNEFYDREQALLRANIAQVNQRVHDNKFNLGPLEVIDFPNDWNNSREISVIIVNSFDSGTLGLGKFPWWGKVTIVALRNTGSTGTLRAKSQLAKTLAHEIGHFLGSPHVDSGTNVMVQGNLDIATRTATVDQIEEWHTKLSRNLARRRNRREG
jgi:hypothetical protein